MYLWTEKLNTLFMTYFILCWFFSYFWLLLILTILTNVFVLSNSMLHTLIIYCTHDNLVYLEMFLLSSLGKDSYWFS